MGKSLAGKELGQGISQRKDGRYQARFTNRFQVIMGHSSVNIIMNLYCHVTEDTLFSEMQKFESGVGTADNISDGVKFKNHIVKAPFFKGYFPKLTILKQISNKSKINQC